MSDKKLVSNNDMVADTRRGFIGDFRSSAIG